MAKNTLNVLHRQDWYQHIFFFLQTKDDNRKPCVTGVKTCPFPIYLKTKKRGFLNCKKRQFKFKKCTKKCTFFYKKKNKKSAKKNTKKHKKNTFFTRFFDFFRKKKNF